MRILLICIFIIKLLSATEISSIKADFVQTITSEDDTKIQYKGKLITTNDKALWDYHSPVEKQLYFLNSQILIIEPELYQAILTQAQNVPNIADFLKQIEKRVGNTLEVIFMDTNYTIEFEKDLPISIYYEDDLANKVFIELKNTILNEEINQDIFNVDIPKEYDIIYQ